MDFERPFFTIDALAPYKISHIRSHLSIPSPMTDFPNYTTAYGSPVNYPQGAQRVSTNGPLILQGRFVL